MAFALVMVVSAQLAHGLAGSEFFVQTAQIEEDGGFIRGEGYGYPFASKIYVLI